MKPSFNFNRYCMLMTNSLRTSIKDTILLVLLLLGVFLLVYVGDVFKQYFDNDEYSFSGNYGAVYWVGLIAIVVGIASRIVYPLRDKAGSISYLMLPASNLEKFLSRWTIIVPGALILYTVGFLFVDLLRYLTALCVFGGGHDIYPSGFSAILINGDWKSTIALFCVYLIYQSFFALGGTIWPKRGVQFTFLWLIGIGLAMSLWCVALVYWLAIDSWKYSIPVNHVEFHEEAAFGWCVAITILVCAFNYTIAYFRFKESEIIPRW